MTHKLKFNYSKTKEIKKDIVSYIEQSYARSQPYLSPKTYRISLIDIDLTLEYFTQKIHYFTSSFNIFLKKGGHARLGSIPYLTAQ